VRQRSWYARTLRLRHVQPGGLVSFLLFECVIAVSVLLALAELASWWAVAALPVAVAAMVKLNDLVSGAMSRSAAGIGSPPGWEALPTAQIPAPSSTVYASGARRGVPRVYGSPVAQPVEPVAVDRSKVERRLDEAADRAGLMAPGTAGPRSEVRRRQAVPVAGSGSTEPRRRSEPEVIARPEWHQTVTLGRHARRDDAERARLAENARRDETGGAGNDPEQFRHRAAAPANQRRFA
jgi:hypothetical protein